MFEELLIELKYADSRVLVTLLEGVFVGPVCVSLRILALHPVSELLGLTRQIFFQLFLVITPVSFEFLLGSLHVPIDRFCFYLTDCLPLDEICFFISGCPRHGAAQLGSAHVLALETHGLQKALKVGALNGSTPSHKPLNLENGSLLLYRAITIVAPPYCSEVSLCCLSLFGVNEKVPLQTDKSKSACDCCQKLSSPLESD